MADEAMSERRAGKLSARSRKPQALGALGSDERADALEELLRRQPKLRAEVERIAREHLADTTQEAVAEQVEWELRSLSSDELQGRAGRQRWGYVEPTEAAWELLEETVAAHERKVERLLALGMIAPAVDTVLGVIAGLYRCRGCEDGELLLSWAPDFPLEQAGSVVAALVKAAIDVPDELLADAAADWEDSLTRRTRA